MCPVPAHPRFEHPIRLATGFDPAGFPELAPPDESVREWTWLADPQTADEVRSRYLARRVRGHGTVDSSNPDLTLQPRSRHELVAGYRDQHVFFEFPGAPRVRARLSAVPEEVGVEPALGRDAEPGGGGGPAAGFPFAGPIAIVGTTPPAGWAAPVAGRRLGEELADFLAGRGIESWEAVAVDSQRERIDHVLLVDFADPGEVLTAAAVHVQPFLSVWRADPTFSAGAVEVIDLTNLRHDRVVARGAADLTRANLRTCPLIPGSLCGDLCEQYGGPWVSRSITAATRWEARRARMIRALGCDTCGDGAIKVFSGQVLGSKRQGISIRPDTATPTRHDRLVPLE